MHNKLIDNINTLNNEDGLKLNLVENGLFDYENIMDVHERVFDHCI
jgi:hypothetical protein